MMTDVSGGRASWRRELSQFPRGGGVSATSLALFRSEDEIGECSRSFGLHARQDMLVDGHSEGGCGVAEAFADNLYRTPDLSKRLAWLWRRSCKRMTGSPERAVIRSNCLAE